MTRTPVVAAVLTVALAVRVATAGIPIFQSEVSAALLFQQVQAGWCWAVAEGLAVATTAMAIRKLVLEQQAAA
jgi:hypothetical protein